MSPRANAHPTKRLFLQMLTRDLALEDAILDLVDNSIDSLLRTNKFLTFTDLVEHASKTTTISKLPIIKINYSDEEFKLVDNCGGIDYKNALHDVFRFGRTLSDKKSSLSVYGIGLKRAIFKMGRDISIESKTLRSGFRVDIDADAWASDPDDWTFPIKRIKKAKNIKKAGTIIVVRNLNKEVLSRFNDGSFDKRLKDQIESAYNFFLDSNVKLEINGNLVTRRSIPVGDSKKARTAVQRFKVGDVDVVLIAGLAERIKGEWNQKSAGWYVLCNGRTVAFADQTEMTGWKPPSLARFVPKYRGFIGIASFFADDPESLPWTTTKRGLNYDSPVYQRTLNRMVNMAKPVVGFLNNMYKNNEIEKEYYRTIADSVKTGDLNDILYREEPTFEYRPLKRDLEESNEIKVQFMAKRKVIEKVRKCLNKSQLSAAKIGEQALKHYVKIICSE